MAIIGYGENQNDWYSITDASQQDEPWKVKHMCQALDFLTATFKNPLRTAKLAANDNHRLWLKLKPHVKDH